MEPHLKRWSTMVPWTQAREKDENSALYRGRNSRPGSTPEEWWRIVSFSQFCPLRGGWTLLRMAQLKPSIAANSNKQDFFFFFTRWSNTGDERSPEWRVYLRGWRVKDVSQCAGPPLQRWRWSVLSARCCCVPSLLGLIRSYSAVLTSLKLVSLFFVNRYTVRRCGIPKIKCASTAYLSGPRETMLMPVLRFIPRSGNSTRQKTSTDF